MSAITHDTIPHELRQLDAWLRQGKPELGWRGDPRLELHMGVLVAAKNGTRKGKFYRKGDIVAHRVEVHRHNEDGTDTLILHRPAELWHEIIPEMVKIDPASPVFKDTMSMIEKHNALLEKHKGQAIAEARGEMTEHLWKLVSDRQNGKTTFRGLPGQNPDKQF